MCILSVWRNPYSEDEFPGSTTIHRARSNRENRGRQPRESVIGVRNRDVRGQAYVLKNWGINNVFFVVWDSAAAENLREDS